MIGPLFGRASEPGVFNMEQLHRGHPTYSVRMEDDSSPGAHGFLTRLVGLLPVAVRLLAKERGCYGGLMRGAVFTREQAMAAPSRIQCGVPTTLAVVAGVAIVVVAGALAPARA